MNDVGAFTTAVVVAFQALLGLVSLFGGWTMARLWRDVDKLRESDVARQQQYSDLALAMARNHATKDDLQRLENKMERGFADIKSDTERLYARFRDDNDRHKHGEGT
jgi:hypothetical protein